MFPPSYPLTTACHSGTTHTNANATQYTVMQNKTSKYNICRCVRHCVIVKGTCHKVSTKYESSGSLRTMVLDKAPGGLAKYLMDFRELQDGLGQS